MIELEAYRHHESKQGETLRESLVGKNGKLPKELTRVAKMINYLDLTLVEKRQLFFYHLWHENGSFSQIKDFIEIKEDPEVFIIDPVLESERLTQAYSEFYVRFEARRKKGRKPQTIDVSPMGSGPAIAFEERMFEILPFREILTSKEISEKTGYSESYVRHVFVQAIKRGLITPINKKELAKRLKTSRQ